MEVDQEFLEARLDDDQSHQHQRETREARPELATLYAFSQVRLPGDQQAKQNESHENDRQILEELIRVILTKSGAEQAQRSRLPEHETDVARAD